VCVPPRFDAAASDPADAAVIDAAVIDAAVIDAAVIDAAVIDGRVVDALAIDAPAPDAPPPDAPAPDAPPPDARPIPPGQEPVADTTLLLKFPTRKPRRRARPARPQRCDDAVERGHALRSCSPGDRRQRQVIGVSAPALAGRAPR
jgi:hypothetical protein